MATTPRKIKAQTSFSLKDDLFNAETLQLLSSQLQAAQPGFQRKRFDRIVLSRFEELELKQRVDWIVTTLSTFLPPDFPAALAVLRKALPPALDPKRSDDDFGSFIWVVPGEFVARHGCNPRYVKRSLAFLREATKRASAEGAIRPFINRFPGQTLQFVQKCTLDSHYHVRRLASEGIRPLLPWAERAPLPTGDIIEVLDQLHADSTRFVTRSVANNLNDIAKTEPAVVLKTLKRWHKEKRQDTVELEWMTRHALRTLEKREHAGALKMLGFATQPRVKLEGLKIPARVRVGGNLSCDFELVSLATQKLLITSKIYFLKANGELAPKVFNLKKVVCAKGDRIVIERRQSFKPMTTRAMYPGTHKIQVVVNGKVLAEQSFDLVV